MNAHAAALCYCGSSNRHDADITKQQKEGTSAARSTMAFRFLADTLCAISAAYFLQPHTSMSIPAANIHRPCSAQRRSTGTPVVHHQQLQVRDIVDDKLVEACPTSLVSACFSTVKGGCKVGMTAQHT